MGVYFMDPVINCYAYGFVLYLMCRLLIWMLMTVLIRTPGVVVLFRYIHSSTLFLQHLIGFQPVLLSMANLRVAFASALLICVFQVCLLSKVILRYVALSVCCSSVSANIIFMGFDLVDKVKSVVKDLVLFIFTHRSCAHLDKMLIASWSPILAVVSYSSVLYSTK